MLRHARYVGERVQRVEDARFLTGRARYIDDVKLPDMVHAAFARSPHPHARIERIDVSRARAIEGVVAVLTGDDLQGVLGCLTADVSRGEVHPASRTPLAVDKVRHVGDPVAVVVATSAYIAEDARDLIDIEWQPLPPVLDIDRALEPDCPLLDESLDTNNIAHIGDRAGDVEAAFSIADHIIRKRFHVGRSTAAPLEARGVIAEYEESSGRMKIWCSSQMPHLTRTLIAPVLRLPEAKITVTAPDVGGGFGLKCHIFPEDVVVPAVSRLVGRPVKWIEDRSENLAASVHSKEVVCDVEVAVRSDGTFTAFRGIFVSDGGAYSSVPYTPLIDCLCAATTLPSLYGVENVAYSVHAPLTNKCQIGAVRGVGFTCGQLALETLIDDVARELGIDPLELRLRNCIGPEPRRNALGASYDGGSYAESLELAAERVEYRVFRDRQARLREQGRYIGVGFSPFVEPTGFSTKSSEVGGFPMPYFDSASLTVEPDGSVTVTTGLQSHGQGHETTFAQVAADQLGVNLGNVRVVFGDTDTAVYGMGTYASRSAVIGTGCIMRAASVVRGRLLEIAATVLEAHPDDIEIRDGWACVKGTPARGVDFSELAEFGYFGGAGRPPDAQEGGLTATAAYDAPETYANGTAAAVVEIDVETGLITIEKFVAVEDCGVMLNPTIVDGQVAGAVAQGIGIAVLEELRYGVDGEFLSGSFLDYLCPSSSDVPAIDIQHIETPSAVSDGGVKGVGEAGTIAAPAAIVNAVADALSPFGVKIGRTPVAPYYLLELLHEAGRPLPAVPSCAPEGVSTA